MLPHIDTLNHHVSYDVQVVDSRVMLLTPMKSFIELTRIIMNKMNYILSHIVALFGLLVEAEGLSMVSLCCQA